MFSIRDWNVRKMNKNGSQLLCLGILYFVLGVMQFCMMETDAVEVVSTAIDSTSESKEAQFPINSVTHFKTLQRSKCFPNCNRKLHSKTYAQENSPVTTKEPSVAMTKTLAQKCQQSSTVCNLNDDDEPITEVEPSASSKQPFFHQPFTRRKISRRKEKNNTSVNKVQFPKKADKVVRFSRKYNPETKSSDSGFIPVPGPYGLQSKTQVTSRRAPLQKQHAEEELSAKESRASADILGNGNFEIIKGGIFSEQETNEIAGGRRVGRGFGHYVVQREQRQFNPAQNFQHPAYFPGYVQPARPIFVQTASFSHNHDVAVES